jgi:hypothetical protein
MAAGKIFSGADKTDLVFLLIALNPPGQVLIHRMEWVTAK